jgi:hypothetical protein
VSGEAPAGSARLIQKGTEGEKVVPKKGWQGTINYKALKRLALRPEGPK